jgi:hypothetical protein
MIMDNIYLLGYRFVFLINLLVFFNIVKHLVFINMIFFVIDTNHRDW